MKTFTNSVLNLRNIDKHQREIKSIVTSRCDQNKICAVRLEEISDKINFWVTSKKKNGGQHGPADCVWCVFFQSDESSLQKMYFVNNIWRYSCQEINRKCLRFGFQTDRKSPLPDWLWAIYDWGRGCYTTWVVIEPDMAWITISSRK